MLKSARKHFVKNVLCFFLLAACQVLASFEASAQGGVSGVIKDALGPVIGVSVIVNDGVTGTTTDLDGAFTLPQIKEGDKITVSFLGYKTRTFVYAGEAFLDITMEEDTSQLDAVVVTALGVKRSEKALSYNVQQVDSEKVTAVKDANFMNSLVGKVAGVQINAGANGAGGAARVVMRGVKSLAGNNLALYVIDGVPMSNLINSPSEASNMSDQAGSDGVADINPDDIESISMLTGPAAAALYGNAAANGVVLITTKKGQAGKTTVTLSNSTTFSTATMLPRMQNRYGNAVGEYTSWGPAVSGNYDPAKFFNTGTNVINTVALSTGTASNQTYISVSTTNSTGILPNSGYDRYNFTARNTTEIIKDKLSLDLGASYVKQGDKGMTSQGQYYNPLPGLYLFPRGESFEDVRLYKRYDAALGYDTMYWPYGNELGKQNPYWVMNRELRENAKNRYMLNAQLKWKITDWFDISGRVKLDNYSNRLTYKLYASTPTLWAGKNGHYRDITSTLNNTYADVLATINKTLGDDWTINANIGASINDTQYESMGYQGNLALLPNFFTVKNLDTTAKFKPQQDGYHDQSQAVFANFEAGWKSMLYLTLTGRNDWESQLAFSNYKSFFYPSVGLSAIISNMFDTPSWLSYLKVRGSYTEVGNSYDRFMTTISYPYDSETGNWKTSTTYPNLDLKPERTKSWEAGLDVRMLRGVFANVTYYRSNTYNQTFLASLSSASGYENVAVQSGNIMNQGVELAVGYEHTWDDFSFSTSYTLTWNQNRVEELAGNAVNPYDGSRIDMPEYQTGAFGGLDARVILRTGGSMGDVYANHLLKRDYNGEVVYDSQTGLESAQVDDFYIGSILPKANMGWNTHFGWKGFDLGFTFSARLGGIVLSSTEDNLDYYGVSEKSARLRDEGGIRVNQSVASARQYLEGIHGLAAYYTYDATNVRLQEVSLNYTLPKKLFKDKANLTLGLIGRNLWMIYCKAPFDPEISANVTSNTYQGFDYFMLPSTRNLGFNVKLQF